MLKSLNEWLASEGVCEGGILELLGGYYFRIENIQTVLNECNTQDEVEAANGLINYGGAVVGVIGHKQVGNVMLLIMFYSPEWGINFISKIGNNVVPYTDGDAPIDNFARWSMEMLMSAIRLGSVGTFLLHHLNIITFNTWEQLVPLWYELNHRGIMQKFYDRLTQPIDDFGNRIGY